MENYKDRLINALPIFSGMLKRSQPIVMTQGVSGGVAGNIAVSKIHKDDQLVSVIHHTAGALPADLTDEFSVGATGYINNTGGTATSSDFLVVTWLSWGRR